MRVFESGPKENAESGPPETTRVQDGTAGTVSGGSSGTDTASNPTNAQAGEGGAGGETPGSQDPVTFTPTGGTMTTVSTEPTVHVDAGPEFGSTAADASVTVDTPANTDSPDASPFDDLEAILPRVVAVTPRIEANGVLKNTPLVITFSAPMNTAATEEAFFMAGATPQISWNFNNTKMSVTLGLDYDSVPTEYIYSVSAEARDAAGSPIEEVFVGAFTLAKRLRAIIPVTDQRNWAPSSTTGTWIMAGDNTADTAIRGFFAYELLPPLGDVLSVEQAVMRTILEGIPDGDPFRDLGDLVVQHARYDFTSTPTLAMYDAPILQTHTLVPRDASAPAVGSPLQLDLTLSVRRTWDNGWAKSQFILAFFGPYSDQDGNPDSCYIGNSAIPTNADYNRLEVDWLCADDCL